ncbi:MAG: alanine--glyoxylate aminotransferase family protein [Cyanobacteria bacterium HKST-UBA04]|nr:alanine--glyoxylate aminotransferase family protein [Cyanobacteria bacterium HKST-UBA04]
MVKPSPMLMIPGPTPVPQEVLSELAYPPMGHRSGAFKDIMLAIQPKLQWLFQTQQPVFTYAASATGAMEAALVNTVNPGQTVLVLACGVFSQRWADIAKRLGIEVIEQAVEYGQPNSLSDLDAILSGPDADRIKAVCLIHNETSTGVINPVEAMARLIRQKTPDALIIIDTVTGLGAAPFDFDGWDIDVAVSGSQKGFMLPPGLAFLAVSQRAMQRHAQVANPGFYFNFTDNAKSVGQGQTPWTSATTLCRGLLKSLELMEDDGLDVLHDRHRLNRQITRAAIQAMGLSFLVTDEAAASPSVTSVLKPDGIEVADLRGILSNEFGLTIAAGQKHLKDGIFRIGHLGAIFPRDVFTAISAIEAVLHRLDYNRAPLGAGITAAQQEWTNACRVAITS